MSRIPHSGKALVLTASVRTFQEKISSRRILYFLKFRKNDVLYQEKEDPCRISWKCHQAAWHDLRGRVITEEVKCLDKPGYACPGPVTWPSFKEYQSIVRSYSRRHFTYDSDVVPAFAGTASSLADIFPGGTLYGLPILFFDVALLWIVPSGAKRRSIDVTSHESIRPPSWSWMAWRGQLWGGTNPFWSNFSLGGTKGAVVSPLVQWYYISAGGAQVRIENELYKYRHLAQDSESPLPSGWSRTISTSSKSDMRDKLCYVTPCAPGQEFHFPIPLVDAPDAVTIPVPASNKITCRTERAYFSLDRPAKVWARPKFPALRLFPHIVDASGSISGKMLETGDKPPEGADSIIMVELIAVSTTLLGALPSGCPFTHLETYCLGARDFYNVLWIEWTDGIAYRKGVGFVTKAAWEAADRELIDVVLG